MIKAPPVSLGAHVLHSYDPEVRRFTWQLRDDWQRITLGHFGKPGPRYVSYVDPGPPNKRFDDGSRQPRGLALIQPASPRRSAGHARRGLNAPICR